MKIKYVGAKVNGERAFEAETGIVWFPGDQNTVPNDVGVKMLAHPDVFASAEDGIALSAAAPKLATSVTVDDQDVDDAATAAEAKQAQQTSDPLAGMDDAAVRAFVKANKLTVKSYGVLKGAKLREAVTAALAAAPK